jgi:hypothetical protein
MMIIRYIEFIGGPDQEFHSSECKIQAHHHLVVGLLPAAKREHHHSVRQNAKANWMSE